MKNRNIILVLFLLTLSFSSLSYSAESSIASPAAVPNPASPDAIHQKYIDFFANIYKTMDENYYYPVSRVTYERFIATFDQKIYSKLKLSGKSDDYIKWRSAAYLVDALKSPEDIFSAFMPPKFAEKYEKDALGKKIDLGIEGKLTPDGYIVTKIEKRSDAFEKGLRLRDLIKAIDGVVVQTLQAEDIAERLMPLENTKVVLKYQDFITKKIHTIQAVSKEYFKQDIFRIPVEVAGVDCLQIRHFNRMTGEDMSVLLRETIASGDSNLILDLRGNPGGPPLAAQEISSFFLKPDEEFTFFQRKNRPKASLFVPNIPEEYQYHGQIAILVDKGSGSASELFSGIMQWRKRAILMGENTAGQVFLKSMFDFDDRSMLLLVTARGHRPDGEVFSFNGLTPNILQPEGAEDLILFAAQYLKNLN